MALKDDLTLHQTLHLQALHDLSGGVPEGLPAQLAELAPAVAAFEAARSTIAADDNLTPAGKYHALQTAREQAHAEIAAWKTGRVSGIDAQQEAQRRALQETAAQGSVAPSEVHVRAMAAHLASLDPLEIEILYSDATEPERLVMEAAIAQLGRVPRRRADGVVWETLFPAERLAQVQAARRDRADPAQAAALHDLRRIRTVYEAMASAAVSLVGQ